MTFRVFATLAVLGGIAIGQPQTDQAEQNEPVRYEGPSILSRDRSIIGERSGKLLDYRFYADITGAYDTGLVPVSTNSSGQINQSGGLPSVALGGGLSGTRIWRHDQLSVDYRGDFSHYPGATFYDAANQFVNLSYAHRFSRRLLINTRETAGVQSFLNGYFTYLPLQNTDLYAVPTNELFDNRTSFLQSRVDMTWQKTVRLSINLGGEGFLIRRRSEALAGANGYDAHADVSYRLNKRQTITLSYQHVAFDYVRQFGDAAIDQVAGGFSMGLGRRWDFSSQFGGARMDFSGLTIVNVDPAIAAIVGQNRAVVAFHRITYIPVYQAQIVRRFERSALTAAYNQAFSPGNGVYLASRETAAAVTYSYTGLKKLTFGTNAGYSRMTSLGQTLGTYNGFLGGAGTTYTLRSYAHLELRWDYRHYTTGTITGYKQNTQRVSLGLAFSPGSKPLPIW